MNSNCKGGAINPALLSGVGLVLIGLMLLLNQMGLIHNWFNFWAMVFFGAGMLNVVQSGRTRVWGVVLLTVGALIQLNQLGLIHVRFDIYWPLLVIGAGLAMLWRAYQPTEEEPTAMSPHLNVLAIWGGGEYRIRAKNFRGGELVAFMGGFDIDLRDADIDGNEAVIKVNVFMGGGTLRVPENWAVSMQVTAFLGGHSLKARENQQVNKTLIIRGTAIMGGLEVRN